MLTIFPASLQASLAFPARLAPALLLMAAAGCLANPRRYVSEAATTPGRVERAASFYVNEQRDASAFVLLRTAGGAELSASLGTTVPGVQKPPRVDTLYRLASTTKIMVYVMALKMHGEGLVDLDAPVARYSRLPLAEAYADVTLRDLLEHRSGLPREFLGFWQVWDILSCGLFGTNIYRSFDTKERLYAALNKPKWQDGVRRKATGYSSTGYGLLGVLLEDAAGEPLETLLQRHLCVPLGLADTTFEPNEEQRARAATPCAGDSPWLRRRSSPVPGHDLGDGMKAAGCLFSTPRDVMRFAVHYLNLVNADPPVGVANGNLSWSCRVENDGEGRVMLYRVGMYFGAASFIGFDLDTQSILLIFRNNTDLPDSNGLKIFKAITETLRSERAEKKTEQD